jgi:hypothetical protein
MFKAMLKKKAVVFALLAVLIGLTGGLIYVVASAGSASDPLVSLSYIEEIFKPAIMAVVDERVAAIEADYTGGLQPLMDQYLVAIEEKLSVLNIDTTDLLQSPSFMAMVEEAVREKLRMTSVTPASGSEVFALVSLNAGQKIVAQPGCEIVLRSGSATAAGTLINVSRGGTAAGTALAANTMYLTGASGSGMTATAACTVMVRGVYSVN